MDYTDWLWIKLIGLVLLAFFGNFFYTLFTGRSLEEERTDSPASRGSEPRG